VTALRIGLHSDLREHGHQADVYREMLGLFARAEELGFDSAWVRSYHFRRTGGGAGFSFPAGCRRRSPFSAHSPRARRGSGWGPPWCRCHWRT
jgi:alkanesulfonate monooxygenase SsuD/methylene tetrahydromethanopterin reductase-like flavin-dependent oxidoreductase (luciferase family)